LFVLRPLHNILHERNTAVCFVRNTITAVMLHERNTALHFIRSTMTAVPCETMTQNIVIKLKPTLLKLNKKKP
jgi:hypothetical protein